MSTGRVFDVVWWIVSGVLLLAVVVFLAVAATLAMRARPLRRAVRRLGPLSEQAQTLQARAVEVSERAADLQERMEEVTAAAERLRGWGAPGGSDDGAARPGSR